MASPPEGPVHVRPSCLHQRPALARLSEMLQPRNAHRMILQHGLSLGLAPPMRSSLTPSVSPQPDMPPHNMQASMLGRTPSGQLPSAYWDRKMASDMSRSGDTRTQLFVGNVRSHLFMLLQIMDQNLTSKFLKFSCRFEFDGKTSRISFGAAAPSYAPTSH